VARRGGGYDDWDLEVEGGGLGAARLRSCVEWYGEDRQLLRIAVVPRVTGVAAACIALGVVLSLWGLLDGAVGVALILGAASLAILGRALWECGTSSAALVQGARRVVDESVELGRGHSPAEPQVQDAREEPRAPRAAWLRATG
jgi:hypothetical protein